MFARNFLRLLVLSQFAASAPLIAAESEKPDRRGIAAYVSQQALPVQLDGRLDEAAWELAPLNARFYQFQPEDGRAAPEQLRTTVKVLVDQDSLVFGIRAWNSDPEKLVGALARRDKVARDQDYIGIWIDPSGHGRSAQFVRINVAGVMSDGIYRADEDEEDLGPDYPVESAVQLLPDGYTMEVRWPLASLRFPYGEAKPWRLMVERSVPHADGMLLLSAPLEKESLHFIAEMEELEGMEQVLPVVQDKPYWELRPELTQRFNSDYGQRSSKTNVGLDISARPRADWVFNATLNPDFSQVEIDAPTSNGTNRIALSLPEKRPFFLESADVLGMRLPAFYSRTVADPRWGMRATWRGADADATALATQDRAGAVVMRGSPYETQEHASAGDSKATLLRARQHGGEVVAGLFLSDRDYGGGARNTVLGMDGQWRPPSKGDGSLQLAWTAMASRTTAQFDAEGRAAAAEARSSGYGYGRMNYSSDDWLNIAQLEVIGTSFANDNGFVPQAGIIKGDVELNRRTGARKLLLFDAYETELHLGLRENRTMKQETVERWLRPGIWFYAGRQTRYWADFGFDRQRGRAGAALHKTPAAHMGIESTPSPWFVKLKGELTLGRQLDVEADKVGKGGKLELEANLRFPLPGGWSLESDHQWNRAWVDHENLPDFSDSAWRWVGTLHATPRDALRVIVQNTSSQRQDLPPQMLEPWSERYRHRSLLYKRTTRHDRIVSIGATTDANGALPGANKGLTLKVQWGI
ncbi:carbohydrate binding family 9 domain-containing protein [Pseudoduganella violaceinigra]|uniref:carbohydrate binding family 9 domain-containing protein n=1 Tax=Pseudoduganella violaceinigra TaxID=246602 RepID=UPI0003FA918E|nr:carbohydrate binding family 9 domain-containing protein [Pseudoduganella violaceinigra]